jgi:hypothetical protein
MKSIFAVLAALSLMIGSASAAPVLTMAAADHAASLNVDQGQPPAGGQLDVDIDLNEGGGAWYTSPVWIAIGIVALILFIALIAAVARGGGTTVIKE